VWRRACSEVSRPPAKMEGERQQNSRRARKAKVEEIFGNVGRACGRSRADGVRRFGLNHVLRSLPGAERMENTDATWRMGLAHQPEDGEPPWWIEMLCPPCDRRQTAAQRAGVLWGDRIDRRTGEPYAGDDVPEGLTFTVPPSGVSRS